MFENVSSHNGSSERRHRPEFAGNDEPAVVLRPSPRMREYVPTGPSRSYSSDRPNPALERADEYPSRDEGFGYSDRKDKSSFDALVDKLDALDQKMSMRKGALQDKTARNPGHPRRAETGHWERRSAPLIANSMNSYADYHNEYNSAWKAADQSFFDKRHAILRGRLPLKKEQVLLDETSKERIDQMRELDRAYDPLREKADRQVDHHFAYSLSREDARARGRYPEQKPTYKDKIGRPTLRGWDENLAKEDMDPDEALEIELELRRMQEAFQAERELDREEGAAIQKRLIDEHALNEIERRLGKRASNPSREANERYGGLGYDADSIAAARRMDRDVALEARRHEDRRGFRPAQKPVDRFRENRLRRESFRDLE